MKRETDPAGSAASSELRGLFDRALELAGEERREFVRASRDSHPALAAELARLVEQHETLDGFLETPLDTAGRELRHLGVERTARVDVLGDVLGDYRILSFLGRGGSGSVYRARQSSLGRDVALKVALTEGLSAGERERFLRGARMAAALHHPNLAQVFDFGEDEPRGLLFYSMRLVEGRTLQAVLDGFVRDGAPEGPALRGLVERMREVAQALGALHAKGIIHQDVKPSNVLIEDEGAAPGSGRAVLVDFGLLKDIGTSQSLSTVWATLPYAAPEVLLRRRVDARADVYSLGLCLYDLCAGATPAERLADEVELVRLSLVAPRVDPDLEAIVHRALEADPARRYASGAELALDLEAWLAGRPVRARRLTRWERARRWVRAHPDRTLRWGLRVAGLLVLLGAAALALGRLRELNALAEEAEQARRSGDIVSLDASVAALPASLRSLFLSRETLQVAQGLSQDAAVARVLAANVEGGIERALLIAGAFVERDGWGVRPPLDAFLLARLERRESGAIRLAARLAFERPAERPGELALVRPLRERLERMLAEPGFDGPDALFALSALGGCGDLGSMSALLERIQGARADDVESPRLGVRSLQMIGRRSQGCGYRAEWLGRDWNPLLQAICSSFGKGPDYGVTPAFDGLITDIALARRRAGQGPLEIACLGRYLGQFNFAAANGDRSFLPAALSELHLRQIDRVEVQRQHNFSELGRVLGMLGDPRVLEGARRTISDMPDFQDELLESRLQWLAAGYAFGGEEPDGIPQNWRPDAYTHLEHLLDEDALAWREFRPSPQPLDAGIDKRVIARWTFDGCEVHLWGQATSLDARQVALKPDDVGSFASLGMPDLSELRFHFGFDQREIHLLEFQAKVQKGARAFLPYEGETAATVSLGGQAHELPPSDTSDDVARINLFLRQVEASGEYVLSLRLDEASLTKERYTTTTLRVYQAEILLPRR